MYPIRFPLLLVLFAVTAASLIAQHVRPNELAGHTKINNKKSGFVEGKTIVGEVSFSGLDAKYDEANYVLENPIYESDILLFLREERASIQPNERLNLLLVEKTIKVLKELLFQKGYFKANVVALGQKLPHNQMRLIFSIERGPISRVSGIRFTGLRNFASEELEVLMRLCLKDIWGTYNIGYINYCAQKEVRQHLYRNGYFQAKLSEPKRRFSQDTVEIVLDVNEGIRYRIGDIKVAGAKEFTEKEILEMLGFARGDVADGKKLIDFVFAGLERIYKDKGYTLFNADFDPIFTPPAFDGLDGTVSLELTIDEGRQFKINNIQFAGVKPEDEQKLRTDFSLKISDTFIQTALETYIKKLNESGRYRFIDHDQHVELRLSEELGNIDIVIKVTPIAISLP